MEVQVQGLQAEQLRILGGEAAHSALAESEQRLALGLAAEEGSKYSVEPSAPPLADEEAVVVGCTFRRHTPLHRIEKKRPCHGRASDPLRCHEVRAT